MPLATTQHPLPFNQIRHHANRVVVEHGAKVRGTGGCPSPLGQYKRSSVPFNSRAVKRGEYQKCGDPRLLRKSLQGRQLRQGVMGAAHVLSETRTHETGEDHPAVSRSFPTTSATNNGNVQSRR